MTYYAIRRLGEKEVFVESLRETKWKAWESAFLFGHIPEYRWYSPRLRSGHKGHDSFSLADYECVEVEINVVGTDHATTLNGGSE